MRLAGEIFLIVCSCWLITAGCIAFFKIERMCRGRKRRDAPRWWGRGL
jgi:hypothetical protein